jgi:hypothetical protein
MESKVSNEYEIEGERLPSESELPNDESAVTNDSIESVDEREVMELDGVNESSSHEMLAKSVVGLEE